VPEGTRLAGVEVLASHGYLASQFLNPAVTVRRDRYGASFGARMTFLAEVIAAIRQEVGRGFVVGVRISAEACEEEGLSAKDSLRACVAPDRCGEIDYLSVTLGTSASLAGSHHIVPPMTEHIGYAVPAVARVNDATWSARLCCWGSRPAPGR